MIACENNSYNETSPNEFIEKTTDTSNLEIDSTTEELVELLNVIR